MKKVIEKLMNSKKALIILSAILGMLILAISGYLVYDELISSKKVNEPINLETKKVTYDFKYPKFKFEMEPKLKIPTRKDELLNKLVVLPKGNYDKAAVNNAIEKLKDFDLAIFQYLYYMNGKIEFFTGKLTNIKELEYLRGQKSEDGRLLEDVDGLASGYNAYIRVDGSSPERIELVTLHEVGHVVHNMLPWELSVRSDEFRRIMIFEYQNIFDPERIGNDASEFNALNYMTMPEEFFSESFRYFHKNDYIECINSNVESGFENTNCVRMTFRESLRKNGPQTFAFIERTINFFRNYDF